MPRQTVLITGASVGIGSELAKIFAANGFDLVLVARSEEKLKILSRELSQNHSVNVRSIAFDLSGRERAIRLFRDITSSGVQVDILVNNAGFGTNVDFLNSDLERELNLLDLNLICLVVLSKLFGAEMRKRGQGRILNLASTAAFFPGPYMACYYASKAFVLSFSEALAEELRGSGVTVCTLCPGPTITEFAKRAGIEHSRLFQKGLVPFMSAAAVARAGFKGLMSGKKIVIPGTINRLATLAARLLPYAVLAKITRKLNFVADK